MKITQTLFDSIELETNEGMAFTLKVYEEHSFGTDGVREWSQLLPMMCCGGIVVSFELYALLISGNSQNGQGCLLKMGAASTLLGDVAGRLAEEFVNRMRVKAEQLSNENPYQAWGSVSHVL